MRIIIAKKVIHILFYALILLSLFFPPFYAIEKDSEPINHCFMGYYSIINIPGSLDSYVALKSSETIELIDLNMDQISNQYIAEFNKIRFIFNTLILSFIYLGLLGIISVAGKISRKKQSFNN